MHVPTHKLLQNPELLLLANCTAQQTNPQQPHFYSPGKAPRAGLKRFPGMGTGVLATKRVVPNDVIFDVPIDYVV